MKDQTVNGKESDTVPDCVERVVSCEELDREVLNTIKSWSVPMRAKSVYLKLRRMFPGVKTSEITASLERISR